MLFEWSSWGSRRKGHVAKKCEKEGLEIAGECEESAHRGEES